MISFERNLQKKRKIPNRPSEVVENSSMNWRESLAWINYCTNGFGYSRNNLPGQSAGVQRDSPSIGKVRNLHICLIGLQNDHNFSVSGMENYSNWMKKFIRCNQRVVLQQE